MLGPSRVTWQVLLNMIADAADRQARFAGAEDRARDRFADRQRTEMKADTSPGDRFPWLGCLPRHISRAIQVGVGPTGNRSAWMGIPRL